MIQTNTLAKTFSTAGKGQLVQTAGYYVAFIAVGLVMASLGPTLPGLAQQTGVGLSQISVIFTARFMGSLTGALFGSRLYDRVAGHPVMVATLIILITALVVIPLTSMLWLLCLVLFIFGFAESTLDIGGNTLLVWIHGRNVGPFMNGLHFFFGVGTFLAPIIVAQALLLSGGIAWAYWTMALILLPIALWLGRIPSPPHANAAGAVGHERANTTAVGLIVLFFILYVGAEIGYGGWIASYALAANLADASTAAYLTSAFFGAFTLGRLASIPLAARFRPRTLLLADLAGCLVSLAALMLWPTHATVVWLGSMGLGLSMASVFPTVYSLAERHMTITGRVSGLFFTGASLGAMSIPWVVGQLFEAWRPQALMVCLFVTLTAATAVIIILLRYLARQPVRGR
jgi:fucose permease